MRDRIIELVRKSNITRSWIGMVTSLEEIANAQRTVEEASSQVSLLDKINVFTDSPEEAQIKDAKQRIKARTADRERFQKEVALFLNSLGEEIEHFAFATRLESILYRASQAQDPEACQDLVKELKSWLLESMPAPTEKLTGDLEKAFAQMGGPLSHSLPALWTLRAVLSQVGFDTELRWGEATNVLRYRPLILILVEECYQAFKLDFPELLLPCDIFQTLRPTEIDRREATPSQQALETALNGLFQTRMPRLLQVARRLAAAQFVIEVNKSNISTWDRVVFWSDTKAEALEKELKEKIEDLKIQLEMEWQSLVSENLALRGDVWGAFLMDCGSRIRLLVSKITATRPSGIINKTCQVAYREEPVMEVDNLRRALLQRYPQELDLEQLRLRASAVDVTPPHIPPEPVANPPRLSDEELVRVVAGELRRSGFHQSAAEASKLENEIAQSQAQRREEMQGAGFLKKVGILAGSLSAFRDQVDSQRQAEALNELAEKSFFQALNRGHSPTAVGLVLGELGSDLAAVTAYVAERRVTDSDGNSSTEYYGALNGMAPVYRKSEVLHQMILDQSRGLGFPLEALELHAQGPTGHLLRAQPLRY